MLSCDILFSEDVTARGFDPNTADILAEAGTSDEELMVDLWLSFAAGMPTNVGSSFLLSAKINSEPFGRRILSKFSK